jgi:hypothetical protein
VILRDLAAFYDARANHHPRTDISGCATFREIVASTRDTCIDAYAHEIPITVIEQKATGWVADYNRLLFKPDREWRQLTGVAA